MALSMWTGVVDDEAAANGARIAGNEYVASVVDSLNGEGHGDQVLVVDDYDGAAAPEVACHFVAVGGAERYASLACVYPSVAAVRLDCLKVVWKEVTCLK